MRTRGERRRLTARAIKRKWDVYWNDQRSSTTHGKRWSYWRRCWVDAHCWQRTPHRYNKKSILGTTVRWDGRRHNMDWDAPRASEWDGLDEPYCTLGSTRSNYCRCDWCSDLYYINFDPFDDPYDLYEYMLWEDPSDLPEIGE